MSGERGTEGAMLLAALKACRYMGRYMRFSWPPLIFLCLEMRVEESHESTSARERKPLPLGSAELNAAVRSLLPRADSSLRSCRVRTNWARPSVGPALLAFEAAFFRRWWDFVALEALLEAERGPVLGVVLGVVLAAAPGVARGVLDWILALGVLPGSLPGSLLGVLTGPLEDDFGAAFEADEVPRR